MYRSISYKNLNNLKIPCVWLASVRDGKDETSFMDIDQPHQLLETTITMSGIDTAGPHRRRPYVPVSIDPTTLLTSTSSQPGVGGATTTTTGHVVVSTNRSFLGSRNGAFRASPLSDIHSQTGGVQPNTPTSASMLVPKTIQVSGNDDNAATGQQQHDLCAVGAMLSLNMSMAVSPKGVKLILKENVRAHIFRNVKFWDRDEHGVFNEEPNSVCGIVLRLCNVLAYPHEIHAPTWWRETKQLVIKTHTDQRNNCIKTVHLRYNGTYGDDLASAALSFVMSYWYHLTI